MCGTVMGQCFVVPDFAIRCHQARDLFTFFTSRHVVYYTSIVLVLLRKACSRQNNILREVEGGQLQSMVSESLSYSLKGQFRDGYNVTLSEIAPH